MRYSAFISPYIPAPQRAISECFFRECRARGVESSEQELRVQTSTTRLGFNYALRHVGTAYNGCVSRINEHSSHSRLQISLMSGLSHLELSVLSFIRCKGLFYVLVSVADLRGGKVKRDEKISGFARS